MNSLKKLACIQQPETATLYDSEFVIQPFDKVAGVTTVKMVDETIKTGDSFIVYLLNPGVKVLPLPALVYEVIRKPETVHAAITAIYDLRKF